MTSLCSSSTKQKVDVGKLSAVEYKEEEKIVDIQFGMAGIFYNRGASITDDDSLDAGQMIVSESNMFCARMQVDGNFAIYWGYQGLIWASNTGGVGTSPFELRMQSDGNLVLYGGDQPTWSSGTDGVGTGPFKLIMQDDGNLVVYDADGQLTWESNTNKSLTDILADNSGLKGGQFLMSKSGQFQAVMETDGNLVVYELQYGPVRKAIWTSKPNFDGPGPYNLMMQQTDGNLVIYAANGTPTWASNTAWRGVAPFKLTMQNDGNLVVYEGEEHKPTWATNTCRTFSSVLAQGKSIRSNEYLTSKDFTCTAAMQSDGNFCIYFGGLYCVWATNTTGKGSGPFQLSMQEDGNLVLSDRNGEDIWASDTVMSGAVNLKMQDDGNLVIYLDLHDAVWASNTDLLKID